MNRAGERVVAVASWLLVAGLLVAPAALGRLQDDRDLWAHVGLCLIAGLAAVGALLSGAPRLRWRRSDAVLLALLVVYLAASVRTVYPRATLAELMRLVDYLAIYFLLRLLCRTPLMLLAAAGAFAGGAALCAVSGVREYLVTVAALHDRSWRVFGPFYNPNLLAAELLMAIPMWAALFTVARSATMRFFCVFALLLCWSGFFLTGSKGGALALLGVLLLGAALAPDPSRRDASRRALLAVGLVCVALAGALLLPPIKIRLMTALGSQSNSTMFRYWTWVGAWRMALARPILGFGPGAFAAAYPRFAIVGFTKLAHQTYLQVAAETGFLGLAAFVLAMVAVLRSGILGARRLAGDPRMVSAAAAAGMLGFCLHNLVDYGWHVTATGMSFWILVGLAAAAWEAAREAEVLRLEAGATPEEAPAASRGRKRRERPRPPAPVARPAVLWPALALVLAVLAAVPAGCTLAAMRRAAGGDPEGASRLDPLNSEYHQTMALIAEQAGREGRPGAYEAALREWHAVERLRPTYPGVGYHLAQIAEDQGRPDEALKQYDRAVALAPSWTKPLVAEAQLLERMGQKARAFEVYRRLDALSESPLFRYAAVDNDFDPNFAYAWVALADRAPAEKARESYVRSARYLRRCLEASRAMEGLWRAAGEWEDKQGPELKQLAETLARRHLAFQDPGPRLRAALLLVDSDQTALAKQLFVRPGGGVTGEGFFGLVIDGWSDYIASLPLRGRGDEETKAADALVRSAAADLSKALARGDWVAQLRAGPYGWSEAEVQAVRNVAGTK